LQQLRRERQSPGTLDAQPNHGDDIGAKLQKIIAQRRLEEETATKVVTLRNIPNAPAEGAAEPIDGWTGPVSRTRPVIIEPGASRNYNSSVANFSQGCTTGWP
jgi:hypothetical protein